MNHAEQKYLASSQDDKPVVLDRWAHCACHKIDGPHLHGRVYNHPGFADGVLVHTSALLAITGSIAVCRSRTYHLAKPE